MGWKKKGLWAQPLCAPRNVPGTTVGCLRSRLKYTWYMTAVRSTCCTCFCARLKTGRCFVEVDAHLPRARRVPGPVGVGNVRWRKRPVRGPARGVSRGRRHAGVLDVPGVRQQLAVARAAASSPAERLAVRPDPCGGRSDVSGVLHHQRLAAVGSASCSCVTSCPSRVPDGHARISPFPGASKRRHSISVLGVRSLSCVCVFFCVFVFAGPQETAGRMGSTSWEGDVCFVFYPVTLRHNEDDDSALFWQRPLPQH